MIKTTEVFLFEKQNKFNLIHLQFKAKQDKLCNQSKRNQHADKRNIITRGFANHVDNCPIKKRQWKGKPYANFIDDCLYCEYCISFEYEDGMLCSGRKRISEIKDFNIPEEQRIKESDDMIDTLKENAFYAGNCPNCGGKLVERQSTYGKFWGCRNYPHCRFTASVDQRTGELKMKY